MHLPLSDQTDVTGLEPTATPNPRRPPCPHAQPTPPTSRDTLPPLYLLTLSFPLPGTAKTTETFLA